MRVGLLTSGATYFSMAVFCLAKLGVLPGGGDKEGVSWTDKAVEIIGAGPVIVAFGVAFTIIASAHFWKAYKRKYADGHPYQPRVLIGAFVDMRCRVGENGSVAVRLGA